MHINKYDLIILLEIKFWLHICNTEADGIHIIIVILTSVTRTMPAGYELFLINNHLVLIAS